MDKEQQVFYERSVCGYAILNYQQAKVYASVLQPEDFTDRNCAVAWDIFRKTSGQDDFLQQGMAEIGATFISYPDPPYISFESAKAGLVEKLKKSATERKLKSGAMALMAQADYIDLADELDKLVSAAKQDGYTNIADVPQQNAAELMAEITADNTDDRIKTGWELFDGRTQGLRLGNVSVIGAFPSTGKTAAALNVVARAVSEGKRTAFFSLEMTNVQLYERFIVNAMDISYAALNLRRLGQKELDSIGNFANVVAAQKTMYLFDNCAYIEQQADRIMRIKPQLVIVDFLQMSRTREKKNTEAERLEYIMQEYKRIANANKCHIMILSQHSRSASGDKASMFNLKGSSAIEQSGDYVAILDRPHVYDKREPEVKATLKLVKNKFGVLGEVPLWFDGDKQRFRELLPDEEYPGKNDEHEVKPF